MTTLIDAHWLMSDIRRRGFSEQQPEGIAEAIKAQSLDHLANKADLRKDIRTLEIRLLKWMAPILLSQVAVFAAVDEWVLGDDVPFDSRRRPIKTGLISSSRFRCPCDLRRSPSGGHPPCPT